MSKNYPFDLLQTDTCPQMACYPAHQVDAYIEQLYANREVGCAYCDFTYTTGDARPAADALNEHIKICPNHPMRKAERVICALRKSIIGLVGAETDEELDAMEAWIMASGAPKKDTAVCIDAIHTIRSTKEGVK